MIGGGDVSEEALSVGEISFGCRMCWWWLIVRLRDMEFDDERIGGGELITKSQSACVLSIVDVDGVQFERWSWSKLSTEGKEVTLGWCEYKGAEVVDRFVR